MDTPPRPGEPIRVLSATHEVLFPEEVVFRIEAKGDSAITGVTLFYKIAGARATVYGYPNFTPAREIAADFRVKTGGASFLPSGVDIEYYYHLRDEQGRTLETRAQSLQYRDPRYDWRELRRGSLALLWHDRPAGEVERVMDEVALKLEEVKRLFGLKEAPPMKAVIFNGSREAQRGFPIVSGAATRSHLYAGFAFREYDLFVLEGLQANSIVHEATHLLLNEAVGSPLVHVPSWLHEGLAMSFESSSRGSDRSLVQAVRSSALPPLRNLNAQPGRPRDVRTFYAQSRSVVSYMMEAYGEDRMTAFIKAMGSGVSADRAMRQVYGLTTDQLDREWRADLTGEAPPAPRYDPGTVATATLISGVVIVVLALTGLKWLRGFVPPRADAGSGPGAAVGHFRSGRTRAFPGLSSTTRWPVCSVRAST